MTTTSPTLVLLLASVSPSMKWAPGKWMTELTKARSPAPGHTECRCSWGEE